jgi:polyhydroxyalkanoate synthesis regulator phasin
MGTPKSTEKEEHGTVSRLAEKGEDAVNRFLEELGKNPRVTEALHKAASAKGKLDAASRKAVAQVGLAPAEDVVELRKKVEALEKRLAKLEGAKKPATTKQSPADKGQASPAA